MIASLILWWFAQAWAVAFIASLLALAFAARHLADVVRRVEDVDRRRHVAQCEARLHTLVDLEQTYQLPTREPGG
jgi:hypothetical protein